MALPRIVFAGTPEFACPALEALLRHTRPVAILTQPDRPAGRGRKLTASPVKQLASARDLAVLQPESLRDPDAQATLTALEPELIITAAYGLLLPRAVLGLPRLGCWNLHASLLPRWRGASPIQQAILAGDRQTGICLMQLDPGMDTGPVRLMRATSIGREETAGELHDRLSVLAAEVLDQALHELTDNALPEAQAQDDALATHAPRISRDDARIDWQQSAESIERAVRAFHPWPVAWGEIGTESVRVHRARVSSMTSDMAPGTLLQDALADKQLVVQCGQGALELLELQAAGRKPVQSRDWINAHPHWRQLAS